MDRNRLTEDLSCMTLFDEKRDQAHHSTYQQSQKNVSHWTLLELDWSSLFFSRSRVLKRTSASENKSRVCERVRTKYVSFKIFILTKDASGVVYYYCFLLFFSFFAFLQIDWMNEWISECVEGEKINYSRSDRSIYRFVSINLINHRFIDWISWAWILFDFA